MSETVWESRMGRETDRGTGSECKEEREKMGVFYFRMLAVSTGDAITGC